MTILYAEDDRDDGDLLMEALEIIDPSIECQIVNNGMQAIQTLHENESLPDFIFLDVNMPVMDGKKCLEEIRRTERFREIPVVIYSTTRNAEEIADLYELGASEFLVKPNTFERLCESLGEMLARLNEKMR